MSALRYGLKATSKLFRRTGLVAGVAAIRTVAGKSLRQKLSKLDLGAGPVMVLGAAPSAERPAGIDDTWSIVTVNGSQAALGAWRLPSPDLTVVRDRIVDRGRHQDDVWRALDGQSTRQLVGMVVDPADYGLEAILPAKRYAAGVVVHLTIAEKAVLIYKQSGYFNFGGSAVSNGVFAVILSLELGASPLVISGLSLTVEGHLYPTIGKSFKRHHTKADGLVIKRLRDRGAPIFTSDPGFASETGLPLWDRMA